MPGYLDQNKRWYRAIDQGLFGKWRQRLVEKIQCILLGKSIEIFFCFYT